LVALTDSVGFVELFEEFFCFVLNIQPRVPIFYQDSTSVISFITKGGWLVRTKHFHVRIHLAEKVISQKKTRVFNECTSKMVQRVSPRHLSKQLSRNLKM
jgi:hypothetical protein